MNTKKTRTIICLLIIVVLTNHLLAQPKDSIGTLSVSTSLPAPFKQKRLDRITNSRLYQMTFIGVPLIAGGLIVKNENDHFRDLRNKFTPRFRYHYDDYLQYSPAIVMVGLKLAGVKGRSSWGRMLTSDAFSAMLMAGGVNLIKHTTKVMRPDGSARNSFPSGHTATVFMTATMLHKEYGMTRSPWYSVGAYSVATVTALSRQLNNRHWLSDVMVGAGIGILSTELGYFFADLIFKDKGITHQNISFETIDASTPPSFFGYSLGFTIIPALNTMEGNIRLKTSTGTSATLEGAYFFNPYIGAGGRFRISNIPLSLDNDRFFNSNHDYASRTEKVQPAPIDIVTAGAGAYFSYPLSNRWLAGSKLLIDYQHSSGNNLYITCRDEKGGELFDHKLVEVGKFNSVGIGTGLSMTFIAKPNLSVRFFTDYDLIPSKTIYKVNNETGYEKFEDNHIKHAITLGASVNIQF